MIEELRTYGYADVRRAITTLHDARSTIYDQKMDLGGGNAALRLRQTSTLQLADHMWAENRDWVHAKFQPRLLFLQRNAKSTEDGDSVRESLEHHYRSGLKTATIIHDKGNKDKFDAQDIVVSYTTSFLSMLKICERLQVTPKTALTLAQRSYILDGRILIGGLREYERRFTKSEIIQSAMGHPLSFERHLAELTETVLALAVRREYCQIPISVIRAAVIEYPSNTTEYLDRYRERIAHKANQDTLEEHVVFEKQDRNHLQRSFVPIETLRAGKALKDALAKNTFVTEADIAATLGEEEAEIIAFANGELAGVNPISIYHAAIEWIDPGDTHMKEMYNQIEII